MSSIINPIYLDEQKIKEIKEQFQSAEPTPYIVLDNFLVDEYANALYNNFPSIDDLNVKRKSYNENKREDYHFERFAPEFSEVREALNGEEWTKAMREISGYDDLHTTLDGYGSGLHQGANGSYVDVHVDFNMHTEKNLHRRINLLLYLNKHWKDEYGGHLELWDEDVKTKMASVAPNFNRALIFDTNDKSYHGYSKINVPEGESRKSMYCYYYTPIGEGFKYRDSKFKARPEEGAVKRTVTSAKENVKIGLKRVLKKLGMKSLDFQDKN